jgi:hypothetical protein
MILIVTYDLKGKRSYTPLFDAIQELGDWAHFIASTWFVATDQSTDEVYKELSKHVNKSDWIFVGTLANGYQGWLPDKAWSWLKQHGLKA